MKYLQKIVLLFVCLALFDCKETGESPQFPDLRIYLDRFQAEAEMRGYDFDVSHVEAAYVDNIEVGGVTYCGYGYPNYDGNGLRRIEISKADYCGWFRRSDVERENLFFHELGHAFFNRSHNEAEQCDGSALSIMTTKSGWTTYTEAAGDKRDYYISELIDPLAALDKCTKAEKDWNVDSTFYNITSNDSDWVLDTDNEKYLGSRSNGQGTGEYLGIESIPGTTATNNGYWFKTFNSPNIPECAEVKFKVKISSTLLSGKGAGISLRAYRSVPQKYGATTEEYLQLTTRNNPVSGELTDYEQELVIPCFTREINQLVIFVVMVGETEGQVRFSDIRIIVKPK